VLLEISLRCDVVVARKEIGILAVKDLLDLLLRPDVEFSLLAFGIGVERGAESPLLRGHFTCEPVDRLVRADAKQRLAGMPMRERQKLKQQRIVVEHLLEMRHQPAFVDGIAREPAAEVIIDAALANALQRQLDHGEVALVAGALTGAPEEFKHHRVGKFGRALDAAVDRIHGAGELLRGAVELISADNDFAFGPRGLRQARHQG
jgi:hypothetical protein